MKKSLLYLIVAVLVWLPEFSNSANLSKANENVQVLSVAETQMETHAMQSDPCDIVQNPISCLVYYNEYVYWNNLCVEGLPNPKPLCTKTVCQLRDIYWDLFVLCEPS